MSGPDAEVEQWFAANAKAAREAAGLSQESVAAAMRERGHEAWKQQTVTKVENGGRRVLLAEARGLAAVLGVSDEQLTWPPTIAGEACQLRQAMDLLWQRRQEAAYAAVMVTEAHDALAALATALHAGRPAGTLADMLAEADQMLKEA